MTNYLRSIYNQGDAYKTSKELIYYAEITAYAVRSQDQLGFPYLGLC